MRILESSHRAFVASAHQKFLPLDAPWVSLTYVLIFLPLLPASFPSPLELMVQRTSNIDSIPSACNQRHLIVQQDCKMPGKVSLDPRPILTCRSSIHSKKNRFWSALAQLSGIKLKSMQPTEMVSGGSGSRGKNNNKFVSREHIAGNRNIREGNAHRVQAMLRGMVRS